MDPAALIEILRKIPFFEDVDYSLYDLAGKVNLERYDKDSIIIKEGEEGTSLYLILSGKVLIYSMSAAGYEIAIQTLGPSDYFGEMSILDGSNRSAGAKALEDTIVFCLSRNDFLEFLNNNPQAALMIIETLSKRLRQANARVNILTETNRRLSDRSSDPVGTAASQQDFRVQDLEDIQEQVSAETAELDPANEAEQAFAEILEQRIEKIEISLEEKKEQDLVTKKDIAPEKMLYNKKYTCPACKTRFESPKPFSKYVRVQRTDNDFCKYYESVNPLYYEIIVCPSCGFAFNEEISGVHMKDEYREEIKSRLLMLWKSQLIKNYCGVRTLEQAVETFLLALFSLEGRPIKKSLKGMLCLKTAWLYRYKGDETKERKYIEKALPLLTQAYETENFTDPKSEVEVAYLLGALNFRAGNYKGAATWLERVLRHPAKSVSSIILNQTRDLWTEVRLRLNEGKKSEASRGDNGSKYGDWHEK